MADERLQMILDRARRSVDVGERNELLALYGVGLAQAGRIKDCLDLRTEIGDPTRNSRFPRAAIQVMIFDGVFLYYKDRDGKALDRLIRARALAHVAGFEDLNLQSCIWMAHLAFNFDRFDILKTALSFAAERVDQADVGLRARFCLVVADSCGMVGGKDLAQNWYVLARIFARSAGERSMLTAIEYNRFVIGLSRIRIDRINGVASQGLEGRSWTAELMSLVRLHEGLGVNVLPDLLQLAKSMLWQLDGDYRQAKDALVEIEARAGADRCGMSQELLSLEIMYCMSRCGEGCTEFGNGGDWLDRIAGLSLDEQFLALPLFENLCAQLSIPYDRQKVASLRAVAEDHCLKTLNQLRDSIECVHGFLDKVRALAGIQGVAQSPS